MRKAAIFVGILVVLALIAAPTAGAKERVAGVTDSEVVVGWTTPLSGPAALWGVTALGGKAWAVPTIWKVKGFSSASLLLKLIVPVNTPAVVGSNLILKVAWSPPRGGGGVTVVLLKFWSIL